MNTLEILKRAAAVFAGAMKAFYAVATLLALYLLALPIMHAPPELICTGTTVVVPAIPAAPPDPTSPNIFAQLYGTLETPATTKTVTSCTGKPWWLP